MILNKMKELINNITRKGTAQWVFILPVSKRDKVNKKTCNKASFSG